tara:strand:- start:55 stop:852 length:798 start_codon:yes stop_codon:yes gene_type:complete
MKKCTLLPLLFLLFSFAYASELSEGGNSNAVAPMMSTHMVDINLYPGDQNPVETTFYFQDGLTLGLDPGYDAGAFNQDMPLSSRLLEDDQGTNFSINAMGIDAMENSRVPLIINQEQSQNFRISMADNTMPEDVYIYIEDVLNGTMTSLKEQDFELIAQSDLNGPGRFYIHFSTSSLSTGNTLETTNLEVYKVNNKQYVTIQGLTPNLDNTTATIYNMMGMVVGSKTLNTSYTSQTINTNTLVSGIYIIKIAAGNQVFSKKIYVK